MKQKDYKAIAEILKDTDVDPEKVGKQGYNVSKEDVALYKGIHIATEKIKSQLANYFEKEEKQECWIFCERCADRGSDARILVDKKTIFPIDCDCGNVIEGFNREQFLKDCGV